MLSSEKLEFEQAAAIRDEIERCEEPLGRRRLKRITDR
jgi:protein-arginine kinase activator protein McsA